MIEDAARANAEWCDAYCRASGLAPLFDGPLWACAQRTPPFYPDAVTLDRGVAADQVLARVDASAGCSVKDSFADLDLPGFDVLFDAEWLVLDEARGTGGAQVVRDEGGLRAWDIPFPPSLLELPDVAFLVDHDWSAIVNRSGHVLHLSNVVGALDAGYARGAAAAQRLFGALPVVGYDAGDALPAAKGAGFRVLGPLRVWMKPG